MPRTVLITGATGFVGGALLARLRHGPDDVRVVVRDAARIDGQGVDVIEGDLSDPGTARRALEGAQAAHYLVHSMEGGTQNFAERDRELAELFVETADAEGVGRLVYLGGVEPGGGSSEHLESRHEVEQILGSRAPELVALRASMVVGGGSASFRTLAQVVQRLPVLALPSWRNAKTQPVAVGDVVDALVAADDVPAGTYAIGGPDTVTIAEMVTLISELSGADKPVVDLPFSSSRLEGAAASLVADADRETLVPLFAGLHEDLVIEDNTLLSVFGVTPTPFRKAAKEALAEIAAEGTAPTVA